MSELKKLTPEEYEELDVLMKEMLLPEQYVEFKKDPDAYREQIKPTVERASEILKGIKE